MTAAPLLRSLLYVPGDRADRVAKAGHAGADAVLIDLEDSVALAAKEGARQPVINAAFRPSADELAAAAALVASYDGALARGQGVVTDPQGRMVDEAVVRRARRLLAGQCDEDRRTT
jgi:citrate lyase subunit beta / citryl-CoA lyase